MNETTAAIPPVENSVEYVDVPAPTPKDLMIGIDIGGTGMKGGIVDLRTGNLVSERFRIPTPQPATPQAIAQVARQIVDELQSREIAPEPYSAIGVDFPAVVKNGVVFSAANVDPAWITPTLSSSSVTPWIQGLSTALMMLMPPVLPKPPTGKDETRRGSSPLSL